MMQLDFWPWRKLSSPLIPLPVRRPPPPIVPRPWVWRHWLRRIAAERYPHILNQYQADEVAAVLAGFYSSLSCEPGICKGCKRFYWCDRTQPLYCLPCHTGDHVASISELAKYY